jgi:hypothetical protein
MATQRRTRTGSLSSRRKFVSFLFLTPRGPSHNCSHVTRTGCRRWRLPLWLLFFGGMVSILTLLYLLTGTVYPAANPWMRFSSHSLGVLKAVKGIYLPGLLPSVIHDTASHPLVQVSYVVPGRVFAQVTKSGDIAMPSPASMRRPSTSGAASLVDSTVRVTEYICRHRGSCSFRWNSISALSHRLLCWFKFVSQQRHVMRNV